SVYEYNGRLHGEGGSGGSERIEKDFDRRRRRRVEQESGPADARRDLFQQLKPFAGYRALEIDEAGGIASGPRQASDEAIAYRIDNRRKNDRNRVSISQQRFGSGRVRGKN